MERIAGIKMKYQSMLYEPHLLFKYRKDCIAFLIAFRLYNNYRSKSIKGEDVKKAIDTIRMYDKEFAEGIEGILPLVDRNSNEVEYLVKYRSDVANWTRYDDTYLIYFFIRRVNLFLDGGVENNVRFIGLYKDFGDEKLRNTIKKNRTIRNLLFYNGQVRFLEFLIGLCKKSEVSGRWEGFYGKNGFWTNFNKYAKAFKKNFGNVNITKILKSQKNRIRENPEAWGGVWKKREIIDPRTGEKRVEDILLEDGQLPKLLRELQDHLYQRQKIIIPAASALSKILKEREDELKAEVLVKFSRLLRGRRKSIVKNLNKEMNMFITHITELWTEYGDFLKKLDDVVLKMEWWYIDRETGKLFNAAARYRTYIKQQLSKGNFLRDLTGLIQTEAADASRAEAKRRIWNYQTFNHLTEEDFASMQELILIAEKVKSKLRAIESYVEFQLARKYTLRLKDMGVEDFTRLKNRNFQFSYVKNVFGRLR